MMMAPVLAQKGFAFFGVILILIAIIMIVRIFILENKEKQKTEKFWKQNIKTFLKKHLKEGLSLPYFNIVAETNENTVVTTYKSLPKRPEAYKNF